MAPARRNAASVLSDHVGRSANKERERGACLRASCESDLGRSTDHIGLEGPHCFEQASRLMCAARWTLDACETRDEARAVAHHGPFAQQRRIAAQCDLGRAVFAYDASREISEDDRHRGGTGELVPPQFCLAIELDLLEATEEHRGARLARCTRPRWPGSRRASRASTGARPAGRAGDAGARRRASRCRVCPMPSLVRSQPRATNRRRGRVRPGEPGRLGAASSGGGRSARAPVAGTHVAFPTRAQRRDGHVRLRGHGADRQRGRLAFE